MPTTTNLNITYPASSDYVTNGAVAMGTIATGFDAFFGASTGYTPTTTNITGATVTGQYRRIGKIGQIWIQVTAGTATATGPITLSLPVGWNCVGRVQLVNGMRGAVLTTAYALSNATSITCFKDHLGTDFTTGDNVFTYRIDGWLELT